MSSTLCAVLLKIIAGYLYLMVLSRAFRALKCSWGNRCRSFSFPRKGLYSYSNKCSVDVIGFRRRCRSQEWTSLRIPLCYKCSKSSVFLTIYTSGNWQWCGGEIGRLSVALHMQCQVIRTAEAAITVTALEGFGSGVLAVVAGEFVGTCEPPFAALPGALVWFFSWNKKNILVRNAMIYLLAMNSFKRVFLDGLSLEQHYGVLSIVAIARVENGSQNT